MASAATSSKPTANGHVNSTEQQSGGVVEGWISLTKYLLGDKGLQHLKNLVDEKESLAEKTRRLENEIEEWRITQRKTINECARIENQALEAESVSKRKDEEILDARKRETEVNEKFQKSQEKVGELQNELNESRGKIAKALEKEKANEDEIAKLQGCVEREKDNRRKCEKEAETAKLQLDDVEKQHQATHQELFALKELTFPLVEMSSNSALNAIRDKLTTMFNSVVHLADKFFGTAELDTDVFRSPAWLGFSKDNRLSGIPLPPTNSQDARRMRAASFIHLVASAAVQHLLQPVYLTEEGGAQGEFLDDVHIMDPPRAHLVRSVLLRVDPKLQNTIGRKRAEAASLDILKSVGALLESSDKARDKQDDLGREVREWCDKTRVIWTELQQLKHKVTVLFEEDMESLQVDIWRRLPNRSVTLAPAQGSAPMNGGQSKARTNDTLKAEDIVAQVWPAFIMSRCDNGASQRINVGYVLVKTQVAKAWQELAARSSSDNSHRRARDMQRRRATLTSGPNNSTENIFLPQGK